jgi:hypothetical protein
MADENEINKKTEDLKNSMSQSEEALKNLAKMFGKNADDMRDAWTREAKSREDYRKKAEKNYADTKVGIDNLRNKLKEGATTAQDFESELGKLRDEVNKTSDKVKKAQLLKEKQDLEAENSRLKVNEIFKNSMGSLGGTVMKGVANSFTGAAKSALSGSDALKVAADFMSSNIDTANAASQVGAKALTDFGSATAGAGGKIGRFGMYATAAGAALGFLSNSVSELAKAGIGFMLQQTNKMIAGFQTMNQAGAMYAGGMQEMVKTGLEAGMTIEQFSKSVAANKDALSSMGLGVGEASKKLASAMKEGGTAARNGMFALGMSVEDQAEAYATVMRRMAGPDQKLKASDAEIAARTEEYAKNLAVLKNLTGEEVKAKQEAIRKENDTLAMNQKMAQMDPVKRKALQDAMDNMSESQRQALRENMIYGTVISRDIAVAQAANSGIAQSNQDFANAVKDGSISAEKAREIQAKNREATERDAKSAEALAMATGEVAQGAGKVINENWQYQEKFSEDQLRKAEQTAKDEQNKGKTDTDKKGAVSLMATQQDFAVKMQGIANKNLPAFAMAVDQTISSISESVDSLVKLGVAGATIPPWVSGILGIGASMAQIAASFGFGKLGAGGAGGVAASGGATALGKAGNMLKGKGGLIGAGVTAAMAYNDYQDIKAQEAMGNITAKDAKKAKGGVVGEAAGGLAGAAGGALVGASLGSIVPVVGTAIGGILGGIIGAAGLGFAGKKGGEAVAGHFAEGGVATGPASGYMAMLHNRELVLPLTDSGAPKAGTQGIEDLMKMFGMGVKSAAPAAGGDMADLIRDQNSKLDDLIRIMGDNRDYTERLMHNMS